MSWEEGGIFDLDIKEYWDYLVWYDEFNYGGKACQEVVEAQI